MNRIGWGCGALVVIALAGCGESAAFAIAIEIDAGPEVAAQALDGGADAGPLDAGTDDCADLPCATGIEEWRPPGGSAECLCNCGSGEVVTALPLSASSIEDWDRLYAKACPSP